MLPLIGAIAGFASPFITEIFGLFKRRQENRHELDMLAKQSELAEKEAAWRMAEADARADAEAFVASHAPGASFGASFVDAAAKIPGAAEKRWFALIVCLFALVDALIQSVRPVITYGITAFYVASKLTGVPLTEADSTILSTTLGWWFGYRTKKRITG